MAQSVWKGAGHQHNLLKERCSGLLRTAVFFSIPFLLHDEALRSQVATVGMVLFLLHPLGFCPDNKRGQLLLACLALQGLLVALHALLPGSSMPGSRVADPSAGAPQTATAAASSRDPDAALASPPSTRPANGEGNFGGLSKTEAWFHRPFAELVHTVLPGGSGGKHGTEEDSVTPIMYHVSTAAEEEAHLGGIAESITARVISLLFTSADGDTEEELAATIRSFLAKTEPVNSIAEVIVVGSSVAGGRLDEAALKALVVAPTVPGSAPGAEDPHVVEGQQPLSDVRIRVEPLAGDTNGLAAARNQAARSSSGSILVFLESHMRASHNWLIPLVRQININAKRIVTPAVYQMPSTSQPQEYADPRADVKTYKMAFQSWALDTAWVDDMTDHVPIMKGDALAMTRRWWLEVGPFESYQNTEAAMSEYSVRSWLAGGEVQVARDSVLGSTRDVAFDAGLSDGEKLEDKVRFVEKWFSKNAKKRFYESTPGADGYRAKHEYADEGPLLVSPAAPGEVKTGQHEKQSALLPESAALVEEDPGSRVVLHQGKRIGAAKFKELQALVAVSPSDERALAKTARPFLECHGFAFYMDLFADEMVSQQMLTPKHYRIEAPGVCEQCCVEGGGRAPHYRVENCDAAKPEQQFYWYFGNGLRNVATRHCVDAAFAQQAGHRPIAYPCMKVNRNQEFQLLHHKLMWGSWCLEGRGEGEKAIQFEKCNAHTRAQEFNMVENEGQS